MYCTEPSLYQTTLSAILRSFRYIFSIKYRRLCVATRLGGHLKGVRLATRLGGHLKGVRLATRLGGHLKGVRLADL